MTRSSTPLFSLFAASCLLVSCAHQGAKSGEAPADQMKEDTSPLITPAEVPWKDMTKQQRGRYMAKAFTPKMRELFQAYDPRAYAKVDCATCHGKDARDKGFKMPNPDLPVLPASEEEFMATTFKKHPEMVKFMGEQVTPKSAELLGLKPFDPKNPDPNAFSCHNCHTLKGEPKPEQKTEG